MREIEKAKKILSSVNEAIIEIEDFFEGLKIYEIVTRDLFEDLNADLFLKTLDPIQNALDESGLQ